MNCYLCHKKVDQDVSETYVLLKTPSGEFLPCHTRHPGVDKEYDRQVEERGKA